MNLCELPCLVSVSDSLWSALSPLVPVWQDEWKPERLHSFGLYVLRTLFLWYLL